jgi:hypothetical protein
MNLFTAITPHKRSECQERPLRIGGKAWGKILQYQAYRCYYCGGHLWESGAEADHLTPISKGGCDCSGNVVAACKACNQLKSGRDIFEFFSDRPSFLQTAGEYSTRILYLDKAPGLFWNHVRPEFDRLLESKQDPKDSSEYWRARRALLKEQAAMLSVPKKPSSSAPLFSESDRKETA